MTRLRLGTRGSALAMVQSQFVKSRLEALSPTLTVDVIVIKTTGDRRAAQPLAELGGKGVFIKELEEALIAQKIDFAVHSLKDVPTDLPEGLFLSAILEREDPRDCLVSRFGEQLRELPRGSTVGTGSLRRQAQIRAATRGVIVQDLRGNLDTRLKRVSNGDFAAIVVAHAGLRRLGRQDEISEVLDLDVMLPAPGQGFVAIESRRSDEETNRWLHSLHHPSSGMAATAERAFLAGLGGGCRVPIAAYAREEKGQLEMEGLVISVDGKRSVRSKMAGPPATASKLGERLAQELMRQGALDILQSVTVPSPSSDE